MGESPLALPPPAPRRLYERDATDCCCPSNAPGTALTRSSIEVMFFSFSSSPLKAWMASGADCSDCAPDFCAVTVTSWSSADVAAVDSGAGVVSCAQARPDVAKSSAVPTADILMRHISTPLETHRL